ncbi:MAG: dihydroorotate dehydrogenase [Defluviitaleaceae bacterium]|nr:dihydroorotate dehydrogenase [Defluviitaleaceae bacterium]
MKLSVKIAGVEWKNPITTASGTVNSGKEYSPYIDFNLLGAITSKGVSGKEWKGSKVPRVTESYGGMISSIGVQNLGVEAFIRNDVPFFRRIDTVSIVNVCGHDIDEYCHVASRLTEAGGIDMLELNISSPSMPGGPMHIGHDWKSTEEVVRRVKAVTNLPVIAKLSPNAYDIVEVAKAAENAGADALSLINTLSAMRIDIERKRPVLGNIFGGLSGPAIKPVAIRSVYQVAQVVKIPIIGMGGIMRAEDAIEFILAGATAIAVGTANFVNPRASLDVLEGIEAYMEKHGVDDVNDLVGAAIL